MREFKLVKLRTKCRDKATNLPGMVTHWLLDMNGDVQYLFQPKGLDESGRPVDKICVCAERLAVKPADFEMAEIQFDILGSQVTDEGSGFAGMATHLVYHPNGCCHVQIQPAGLTKKKTPIQACEFDLRQCSGPKIPVLTEPERKASTVERPSPEPMPGRQVYGQASLAHSRSPISSAR